MKKYNGILEDNRPKKLKDKDFDSREVDMGEVKYVTKKQAEKNASEYTYRNQYTKSSCVPSSICNALWNTEGINLADEYLYSQRINKPDLGCYWYDIADKVISQGVCGRIFLPEVKTEKEANNISLTKKMRDDALFQKQKSYINITKPTIDDLAKWSNQGYAVPFSIWANSKEWSVEYPEIKDMKLTRDKASIRHAICVIPNTGYIYKKKKYVIITDSSHFGKRYIRHLSEDFLAVRTHHAVVFTDLIYYPVIDWVTTKHLKGYKFTRDLKVGDEGDDVKQLQILLQDNSLFPANQEPTGYFGGVTRQGVKDFQKRYEQSILWSVGLKLPTGYFGKSSRKKMEELIK